MEEFAGGAAELGTAGLAQPPPRPAAQAFGNRRLSKGLSPAALEAQGDRGSLPSLVASLSCFVLKVSCFPLQSSARGFSAPPILGFLYNFWHERE